MRKHCALQQLPASLEARIASLTRMEQVVLEWVEKGKRNSEIATILGRSERTIDCHVAAILQKLGVETRGAAGCALRDAQANGSRDGGSRETPKSAVRSHLQISPAALSAGPGA